jgi:flavin reductase (DIM6/NTAB) family NADH-FMN oxidoreductase RutF
MTTGSERTAMSEKATRDALRLISYGLYVLTTARQAEVHAITFNWLTQVSFEPLRVVAAVEKQSHSHQLLQDSGVFAINFLGREQLRHAQRMAVPHRMNPHKMAGVPYHIGVTGAPLLDEAIGYLECRVVQRLDVNGDHTLFVGEVVAGAVTSQAEPLTLRDSRLRYK